MAVQLIQLSRHSYLYRGFTIQKCPRNPFTLKHSYRISSGESYFGRDFALAEAMKTVDKLKGGHNGN
ncbi:DUF4761 family protein [Salmonella enterica subsp. salamae]|nr:DUF4761 family protein [Salmonella enterica subsp. salamae]ELA0208633.1 DUF4761 family protein [Klebsiella aerogenes]ELA0229737.1 DUF4761 family protein [Klebsiella aerogenes]HEJ8310519.1 DUF4761 family protein [Klebsiella michiganensis]